VTVPFTRGDNSIVQAVGATAGRCAEISVQDGKLTVASAVCAVYGLSGPDAGITGGNLRAETSSGCAVGNEF
jgi:hypothetical protein